MMNKERALAKLKKRAYFDGTVVVTPWSVLDYMDPVLILLGDDSGGRPLFLSPELFAAREERRVKGKLKRYCLKINKRKAEIVDLVVDNLIATEAKVSVQQYDELFNDALPRLLGGRVAREPLDAAVAAFRSEKGGRGQANYAASKGAINAFTKAMAVELAPRKISVNAIAPGVIETDMSQEIRDLGAEETLSKILLKRYGKPEEIAYAVCFLASRYGDYINGEILHIDGGFKMA